MKKQNMGRIAGLMAAVAIFGTLQAQASLTFDLTQGNSAISGYSGPYAQVDVSLTDSTHATITFTSLTAGGNIYLLGDGGSVGVNVNAPSWTLGTISGVNAGTGFTPGPWSGTGSNDGSDNVSDVGTINQTITSFDGFGHSSDTISFALTDTGGTWATANDVLAENARGNYAEAHIFVTASPADVKNGSALATGYASGLTLVPEPTTMIAGALLLLPFGASTLRFVRKNRAA
jgi:hypothetical protein